MALKKIVAFAGGVGGAKLAQGLALVLPPEALTVVINVGDDFEHYGLKICPDLDTVMYTLSAWANPETGWGVREDSFRTLEMIGVYGEPTWFRLGDRDFATHILRHAGLSSGQTLTQVTAWLAGALGIQARLLPASDQPAPTWVHTQGGERLAFQDYFVRQRWQPVVTHLEYTPAPASPDVLAAMDAADAFIICPSNPFLSLAPMLALTGLRERLEKRRVPCIAVSPLVGGVALKGPADKLLAELGYEVSDRGIFQSYQGLIDALVVHSPQSPVASPYVGMDTLLPTPEARARLALALLAWLEARAA